MCSRRPLGAPTAMSSGSQWPPVRPRSVEIRMARRKPVPTGGPSRLSNRPDFCATSGCHSEQLRVDCRMRKVEAVFRNGIERDIHDCGVGRAFILPQYHASHERPAYPGIQPRGKLMTFWIGREGVKPAVAATENIEPPCRRRATAARSPS